MKEFILNLLTKHLIALTLALLLIAATQVGKWLLTDDDSKHDGNNDADDEPPV